MDQYIAKTLTGLEEVLKEELIAIGAKEVKAVKRGVSFKGDKRICYLANYKCRTSVRILKHLAEFEINNPQELYDHVYAMDWHKIMGVDSTFKISAVSRNCDFINNSIFASQKIKDAIVDKFRYMFDMRPDIDKDDPEFRYEVMITGKRCLLMIDSSGESLHLRGYRQASNDAPINEVLAAGLLRLAKWDGTRNLFDPMCGSGTILIEAAMIASQVPAGFYRKKWAFQNWHDYEKMIFNDIKKEENAKIVDSTCDIVGADKDAKSIKIAIENIDFAKFENDINIYEADFFETEAPDECDVIVTNPPYNLRIEVEDNDQLYEDIGDKLKDCYKNAEYWVITGSQKELKKIGLKAGDKHYLFNGSIECTYCQYLVF